VPQPNILLIVVDCLRADHAYDRSLSRTPVLGGLIENGYAFSNTISSANCTTPSFAAILTGLTQIENGVRCLHGDRLNPSVPTLAEALKKAGYSTYAEASGPLGPETGLERGFTEYNYRMRQGHNSPWGQDILRRIAGGYQAPWFLMLHIWDLHGPRWVIPECRGRECGSSDYARALSSIDVYLQALMRSLPANTVVVLTGDHGEDFSRSEIDSIRRYIWTHIIMSKPFKSAWKRGLIPKHVSEISRGRIDNHYDALFEILIRVPLIFHAPGILRSGASTLQVRHVDIAPTILELAGVTPSGDMTGQSLAGIMRGEPGDHREAYIEVGASRRRRALPGLVLAGFRRANRYKYVCTLDGSRFGPWLYDLEKDPDERQNIAATQPELIAEFRNRMQELQSRRVASGTLTTEEHKAVQDRLKALGYM